MTLEASPTTVLCVFIDHFKLFQEPEIFKLDSLQNFLKISRIEFFKIKKFNGKSFIITARRSTACVLTFDINFRKSEIVYAFCYH